MQSKFLILPYEENVELQKILVEEYDSYNFAISICELLQVAKCDYTKQAEITRVFLYTINKIILDNLVRYVVNKDTNRFITLLNNNTFQHDLYVNPIYLDHINSIMIQDNMYQPEIERCTIKAIINNIINMIHRTTDRIKQVLFNLFNCIEKFLGNIYIKYYRVEVVNSYAPAIILEGEYSAYSTI